MSFKSLFIFAVSFLISTHSLAQSDIESTTDQQRTVFDIRNEGGNKYLKILEELESFESEDRMQQAMKSAVITPIASFLAPNAAYDSLLKTIRHQFTADSLGDKIRAEGLFGMDALQEKLRNEISETNLVMFNEHHYYPTHRMLVERLLPLFAESGYTYLGLEALAPGQDSLLNAGNPPTVNSGFYTQDPRFANLIRTAQSLDFEFVAYENTDRNLDREEGQAANLVNATFAQDPEAKVLVLAGMDHILEDPTQRGKKWLGAVLKEQYSIDPLTINQHHLKWFSDVAEDVVLVDQSLFSDPLLNSVDLHLVNNLSLGHAEPNFEFENTHDHRVQLSIYLAEENSDDWGYDELIPILSRLIEKGEIVSLSLPNTDLYMVIYDEKGDVIEKHKKNQTN